MSHLVFVNERAEDVLLHAYSAYQEHTHLYQRTHSFFGSAPQHVNVPSGITLGSQEHVVFLFLTTLVTLQSSSDEGFRQAVRLYETEPTCFTCEAIHLAETPIRSPQLGLLADHEETAVPNALEHLFKTVGFNKPAPWACYWSDTVRTLYGEYEGDPLAIVADVKTVDGFLNKKRKEKQGDASWWFNGYGPKLFSLFCIFCEELGLTRPVPDAFPVDVHIQRIALGTGIVAPGKHVIGDTLIAEFLRHNLVAFCDQYMIDRVDLAHALWFLGSKGCRDCSRTSGIEHLCPVAHVCAGSPSTTSYWKRGRWELALPWNPKGTSAGSLF